jgi:hypothetical protein
MINPPKNNFEGLLSGTIEGVAVNQKIEVLMRLIRQEKQDKEQESRAASAQRS